jgi:hypothetical protein
VKATEPTDADRQKARDLVERLHCCKPPEPSIVETRVVMVSQALAAARSEGHAAGLKESLDSAPAQDAEAVERVAEAIFAAKWNLSWSGLADEKKDDFRRYAQAAIAALARKL